VRPATLIVTALLASTTFAGDLERWYVNEEWYDWHPAKSFGREGGATSTPLPHEVAV